MATIATGRTFNASTTISTGLKGNMAYNVLANVLGQLSDGIWENSNTMRNYWPYVRIELVDGNDINIVIDECLYGSRGGYNKFRTMNAASIKDWLAKKAKSVVNHEAKTIPLAISASIRKTMRNLITCTIISIVMERSEFAMFMKSIMH